MSISSTASFVHRMIRPRMMKTFCWLHWSSMTTLLGSGLGLGNQSRVNAPALNRNRESGHALLYADYFENTALFKPHQFRRRFRMARHVFNLIREGVVAYDPYFEWEEDALGKLGFSSYQKCTAAIRMLAYGSPVDLVDEYVRMSESTCLLSMYSFCNAMVVVLGPEYLREPIVTDIERFLAINAERSFPGILASIDCMC